MKTHDSRFNELLNRLIAQKATEAEKEELRTIVESSPEYKILYQLFVKEESQVPPEVISDEATKAFDKHKLRMINLLHFKENEEDKLVQFGIPAKSNRFKKHTKWTGLSIAASILFILGFVYYQQYGLTYPLFTKQYQITTLNGERKSFDLPDGTHVWLNGGSKLTYDENFDKHDRPVTLTGEAFFDVAKNAQTPFVIQAGEASVKVLGTSFNLRAYPEEEKVETTLIEGEIEMTINKFSSKKMQVKPGQKLSIDYKQPLIEEEISNKAIGKQLVSLSKASVDKNVSIAIDALWLQDILVFDAEPLSKVASKLEKWYDVKVEIENEDLRKLNFSGVFKQTKIENVLNALQATGSFEYRIRDNTVYIK